MNSWIGAHEDFCPQEFDAGACDLEGKNLQIYSKNSKKNLQAREWGPLASEFHAFLV